MNFLGIFLKMGEILYNNNQGKDEKRREMRVVYIGYGFVPPSQNQWKRAGET